MSRNNDYTSGNSLDHLYHHKYYKLIDINLSKQTNTCISQETNFIGRSRYRSNIVVYLCKTA